MGEEQSVYRAGTSPTVAIDGARGVARNPGRELFPATWLRRKGAVSYDNGTPGGADLNGVLLEWCGVGLIVGTGDGKTLVSWDAIRAVELAD